MKLTVSYEGFGSLLEMLYCVLCPYCSVARVKVEAVYFVVVVIVSLTPRSNPVEMPKSQEEATVVASTCSSMPYATFIEAAESG